MPEGFLWGAAISAYRSEGNDVNSDSWLLENLPETVYKERSGDACDSYHRYAQDFAIARSIGLNCYRLGSNGRGSSRSRVSSPKPNSIIMRVCWRRAARTG